MKYSARQMRRQYACDFVVADESGRIVALCDLMKNAEMISGALNQAAPPRSGEAVNSAQEAQERAAFEANVREVCGEEYDRHDFELLLDRYGDDCGSLAGRYVRPFVHTRWMGWLARVAARSAVADETEVEALQKALAFWLPNVPNEESDMATRIADDARLLYGYDAEIVPSAQDLGWISLGEKPS